MAHGEPNLMQEPRPPVTKFWETDVYDNPDNPPLSPEEITGFCAMQWQDEVHLSLFHSLNEFMSHGIDSVKLYYQVQPSTGKKFYKLANFSTEAEAAEAGWNVTHKGHCGACSSLQDLGVYISQNLTESTRRCGLFGSILGTIYDTTRAHILQKWSIKKQ